MRKIILIYGIGILLILIGSFMTFEIKIEDKRPIYFSEGILEKRIDDGFVCGLISDNRYWCRHEPK